MGTTTTNRKPAAVTAPEGLMAPGAAWAGSASIPCPIFHVGSDGHALAFAGNTGSLLRGPGGFTLTRNRRAGSDPFPLGNIAIMNISLVGGSASASLTTLGAGSSLGVRSAAGAAFLLGLAGLAGPGRRRRR